MTENADVEWLRMNLPKEGGFNWGVVCEVETDRLRRLLAHIDQLEAEHARLIEIAEDKIDINVRPTVHEIASRNMQGLMARGTAGYASWQDAAVDCFDAAAALMAEGRRRDAAVRD